jgi:uncharacterized membrane protein
MWAGLFPATDASGAFQEDQVLHVPGFIMTFLGAGIGLIVMSRRMVREPRWKSLATYALATGIAVLLLLLAGGGLVRPSGAPLHPWWGLFQWILLTVWLPCTVVLALRMLRVARAGERRTRTMADSPPYPGTPRWVKVFGIIALVVVLLFVILMFTRGPGGHGPGRHTPSRDPGGQTPPSSVTEHGVLQP